ncbi:MAG: 3'(2'),5'-bisphosphate nucleotidase CysQ [Gammaproteobacteria bacterium]|jgi:3'(2'), 5'-bisphosphate nucleotidase|nr:3'(2'),5'-bisphosphate nucleotidase CysQ [Gammaproteobacteria bacterium]
MISENLESIILQLEKLTRSLFSEILRIYKDPHFKTKYKKDGSPVTDADMISHNLIIKFLKKEYPNIPIVSEESFKQTTYKPSKEFWLIDPLDGTKGFVDRSGEFTTNIALIQDGMSVLGIVGAPMLNKVWSGISKRSPNQLIKIKKTKKTKKTLRIIMSKNHQTVLDRAFLNHLNKNGYKIKIVNKGSSMKICALVDKKADIYPRFGPTSEWDIAAADAVLRSNGGGVFQIENGQPLEYGKKDSILNPMFIAIDDLNEKRSILSIVDRFSKNLL